MTDLEKKKLMLFALICYFEVFNFDTNVKSFMRFRKNKNFYKTNTTTKPIFFLLQFKCKLNNFFMSYPFLGVI